jgi:hypothetical protein
MSASILSFSFAGNLVLLYYPRFSGSKPRQHPVAVWLQTCVTLANNLSAVPMASQITTPQPSDKRARNHYFSESYESK